MDKVSELRERYPTRFITLQLGRFILYQVKSHVIKKRYSIKKRGRKNGRKERWRREGRKDERW